MNLDNQPQQPKENPPRTLALQIRGGLPKRGQTSKKENQETF